MVSMKHVLALMALALLIAVAIVGDAASNSSNVVLASEILAKIKMGMPVQYDHVTIEGDLNLTDLAMPVCRVDRTLPDIVSGLSQNATLIESSIRVNDSIIEGDIAFSNLIFNGTLDFAKTQLIKNFVIEGSEFRQYAKFDNARFNGTALFRNSWFKKDMSFSGAEFLGNVDFNDSRFEGDLAFVKAVFAEGISFRSSKFKGEVRFDYAQFKKHASFSSTEFGYSWFYEYTDFNHAKFAGDAIFNKIYFANDADFRDAEFDKYVSFESSQFIKDALFQNATFRDGISLTRTKYNHIYINFADIKAGLEYDESAYQLLMKNYEDLGFFADADDCYMQFRKKQLKLRDPIQSPLLFLLDFGTLVFYGYGIRPIYPLSWSILIIALFGIYWRKNGIEEPFRYSFTLFLSGTRLFIEPPPRGSAAKSKSFLKDMFTIERLLGGIFSLLLLLAISGSILR